MTDIVGTDGIHSISGLSCDLCGKECDSKVEELNFLTCASSCCPPEASMYHQHCIEKFLKQMRVERNRKTGFDCPRGKGKGSVYMTPCNGKIQKSHPVHIRNDDCANRRKAKPVEPPQARFIPRKERPKATQAEPQPKVKAAVQAKQKATAANQPAKRPVAFESKQTGDAAAADRKGAFQGARNATQAVMPMQQPVEKKVLVMPSAAPKLDRDALRAAKLASRRELGLPVSPPMSTQQALRPQGKSLRPVGKGQQKAGPGAASPAASMWKKATPKQTGSVVSTSPPVRTVSEFDTASSQSPDWTSHDEPELQSPRLQHSSQKPLRHQFVAKGISSEAASSPMTPNAIKAFQPEPSEHDNESSGSLSSPSAESVIGLQQDKDAESVFTDVDHDGLFCMEGGSSSDAPELYQLDNRPHDSTGYASPDLCDMAMKFSCQQQNFLAVLALQKAQACALQYQMLGFSKHQGIAAVNKFGDNLQSGLAWLLSASEQYLQSFGANVPSMDITENVEALASIQQAIGMSASELHQIVIGSDGSMRSIKSAMLQWAQLHKVDTALDASPLRSVIPANPQVLQSQLHSDWELVQSLSADRMPTLVAEAGKFHDGPTSAKASAKYLVNQNVGHSASRAGA